MSRPHIAAIVEDAWNTQRERFLRTRGWRSRVVSHTGYGACGEASFVRIFGRVLLARPQDDNDEARQDATYGGMRSPFGHRRGWRAFITNPAMYTPVEIRIGDRVHHARSDRSGHLDVTIREHDLPAGWHEVTIWAQGSEPVLASVVIVDPQVRWGLVSDVDDTVLSTSLPRPLIAAWNTFIRHESARRMVPGMAPLYRALVDDHPGAPVVYVSTGAWNTAPTLTRFLRRNGFPMGPLLLTDWGPTNTGWFRSGREHKRSCLDRLARDFPKIKWLLVGDDGQHDLSVYSDFAAARPRRVDAIAIRQLTPTEQVLSHGLPVSTEELTGRPVPVRETRVFYGPDGYALLRLLRSVRGLPATSPRPGTGTAP